MITEKQTYGNSMQEFNLSVWNLRLINEKQRRKKRLAERNLHKRGWNGRQRKEDFLDEGEINLLLEPDKFS